VFGYHIFDCDMRWLNANSE